MKRDEIDDLALELERVLWRNGPRSLDQLEVYFGLHRRDIHRLIAFHRENLGHRGYAIVTDYRNHCYYASNDPLDILKWANSRGRYARTVTRRAEGPLTIAARNSRHPDDIYASSRALDHVTRARHELDDETVTP